MTKRPERSHAEFIDSVEKFYGLRITEDRQYIIQRSVHCEREHSRDGIYDWCPLAHEGKRGGSIFWCDCPCHTPKGES